MKLYAEMPRRRALQIAMDLGMLLWTWWWGAVGAHVAHRFAEAGRVNGTKVETMGTDISTKIRETTESVALVPMVGDTLSSSLLKLTGVGDDVHDLGPEISSQLADLGTLMGALTAGLPILALLGFWLRGRAKYALQTTRAVPRDRSSAEAVERLALMALVHRDADKLAGVHPCAMSEWRDGNEEAMVALAELELNERGLFSPRQQRSRRRQRAAAAQSTTTATAPREPEGDELGGAIPPREPEL